MTTKPKVIVTYKSDDEKLTTLMDMLELPDNIAELRRAGKLVGFCLFQRFEDHYMLDATKFCRGWENYPKASTIVAFRVQLNYLLKKVWPHLREIDIMASEYPEDQWSRMVNNHGKKLPEVIRIVTVKKRLKEAWSNRPKGVK